MWKRIAPLLVVFSVALNVAFGGVWGLQVIRSQWSAAHVEEQDGIWCPLHRDLNVTPEQWRQIEPRMANFRRDSQALCKDINRLRAELIDLIAARTPDRQAIAGKQGEIRAGQHRMQQLVIGQLLAEKEVLTADQQKQLFEMLRQRSACAGPGRMLGLSGASVGHPASEPDGDR